MAIPKLYRVADAARLLQVSARQVRRYMDTGTLGHVHIHGRNRAGLRLVPETAIIEFLNRYSHGCRFETAESAAEPRMNHPPRKETRA